MKFLLSSFAIISFLSASTPVMSLDSVSAANMMDMQTSSQGQKDIKTKADFMEFVSTLEGAMKMGQINPYAYLLGMAYLNDIKVVDGVIPKNIEKARYYLRISYNDGNYAAAYHLAMILVGEKQYDQALFLLDSTIQKLKRDKKQDSYKSGLAESFLVTTFGTVVLEYKAKDKEAILKAIEIMESSRYKDDAPTALFILANLYHLSGNTDRANALLNKSCKTTGKNKDIRLDRICSQFIVEKEGS
jgi:tetratricopeptide (TPR) repeat protein